MFMEFGDISYEIFMPINYFLMLQMLVIGCFPMDIRFFVKLMTAFYTMFR